MLRKLTSDLLDLTATEVGYRRAGAALQLSACCCSCCCDCLICNLW
jgi:hypothetical protein